MKIIKVLKDTFLSLRNKENIMINNIVMDSRSAGKNDVFFAINNGNKYVESTLKKGVSLVIYDDSTLDIDDERAILVEDTILTMQEIARDYIKMLDTVVVGITGTSGKTSTKDMVYSLLNERFNTLKSEGNYNNHIGLPYTILQAREEHEVLVLEMGMSHFGEIDRLCQIANPKYGIITNIGESHLEYLETVENVFKAKGEMLKYLEPKNTILMGDDPYLSTVEAVKVGENSGNTNIISKITELESGIEFILDGISYKLEIPGYYNTYNLSLAILLAKELGLSENEIKEGIKKIELSSMRYEKVEIDNTLYINDAYNAEPLSVKSALKSFDRLYNNTYKVLVLGDMLELGRESKEYHKSLYPYILNIAVDKVYLYGDEMKYLSNISTDNRIIHYDDKELLKEDIKNIKKEHSKVTILLKGSRGMKLEEIIT